MGTRLLTWVGSLGLSLGAMSGCGGGSTQEGVNGGANGASQGGATGSCPTSSGFAFDEMCLPAPPPDRGLQLHYGPSSYGDPASTAPYVLSPGQETVDCSYMKTPNEEDVYVSGYKLYMRPGSHHLNVNIHATEQPDGFAPCDTLDMSPGLLAGSETPKVEEEEDPAPENQGLAVKVPAHAQASVNFHVINTTNAPTLREAWLNYFYIDPSEVKGVRGNVFLLGGIGFNIQPGTSKTYTYACTPDRPIRILSLQAHLHAHGTRLSAWKVSAGHPTLVYEDFDWFAPATMKYDSAHTNTPSDRATLRPGGSSGTLELQAGDSLQWECAVNNTSNQVLTFRNEVFTGEMCVLGGGLIPLDDPMQPYDFKCTRQ